jgi:hypothetical protein
VLTGVPRRFLKKSWRSPAFAWWGKTTLPS